jgi:hypothetical protein
MVNIFLTFCAFFPSFISNTNTISINFRANLDAQNAGSQFPGFKFQKRSAGVRPQTPLFMCGMSATRGLQPLIPPSKQRKSLERPTFDYLSTYLYCTVYIHDRRQPRKPGSFTSARR